MSERQPVTYFPPEEVPEIPMVPIYNADEVSGELNALKNYPNDLDPNYDGHLGQTNNSHKYAEQIRTVLTELGLDTGSKPRHIRRAVEAHNTEAEVQNLTIAEQNAAEAAKPKEPGRWTMDTPSGTRLAVTPLKGGKIIELYEYRLDENDNYDGDVSFGYIDAETGQEVPASSIEDKKSA
jgi:hypothetical protein